MAIIKFCELLDLIKKDERYLSKWELDCPADIETVIQFDPDIIKKIQFGEYKPISKIAPLPLEREVYELFGGQRLELILNQDRKVISLTITDV